jgi:hypothetical protein
MSTEPGQLFADMRDDLGEVLLAEPAALRRVGTRRRRRNRVAGLAAVALLVGGVAIGTAWAANRPTALDRPEVGTSPASSPTPSADPSGEAVHRCTDDGPVPYRVFLQPGQGAAPAEGCAPPDGPYLPAACAAAPGAVDAGIEVQRTIAMYIDRVPVPKRATTPADFADQTVTRYGDAALASRYLHKLHAAVRACPKVQRDGILRHHDVVRVGFAGDESILVAARYTGLWAGAKFTKIELAAVVRVGRVVVVYFAHGWENASADRGLTLLNASKAADRVRTWQ